MKLQEWTLQEPTVSLLGLGSPVMQLGGTSDEDEEAGTQPADAEKSSAETEKTDQAASDIGERNKDAISPTKDQTIPYERFHEVNTKWHETERQVAALESELKTTKEKIAAFMGQKAQDEGKSPFATPEEEAFFRKYTLPGIQPLLRKIQTLEEQIAVREETIILKQELAELQKQYPDMDADEVLVHYSTNQGELKDLAKASQEKYQSRDKTTIEKYVAGKKNAKSGGMPPGSSPSLQEAKMPKDLSFDQKIKWAGKRAQEAIKG